MLTGPPSKYVCSFRLSLKVGYCLSLSCDSGTMPLGCVWASGLLAQQPLLPAFFSLLSEIVARTSTVNCKACCGHHQAPHHKLMI